MSESGRQSSKEKFALVQRAQMQPETIQTDYADARDRLTEWAVALAKQMPESMNLEQGRSIFEVLNLRSQLHADAEHLTRFLMGVAVVRVKMSTPRGEDVVGQLCAYYRENGYQIHPNTLRYYAGAARKFGNNVLLFDKWLKTGKPKKQYDVVAITRAHEDPEVLGADEFARVIERQVFRAAEAVQRIPDPVERHELQLLLTEAAMEARDYVFHVEVVNEATGEMMGIVRSDIPPDVFKTFVMMLNCIACGKPPPIDGANDPHHVDSGHGMAKKGSDWTQVPLCRKCHNLVESLSTSEFQRRTGIHMGASVARVLHIWLSGDDVPGLTTTY